LARLASEGYAAAQVEDVDVTGRQRARLARMIVSQPDVPVDAITEAAAQLSWPIPQRVVVLDLCGDCVELGDDALIDNEQRIAVLPAPAALGTIPGAKIAIGATLPFADAAHSLRWARLAARLRDQGVLADRP